MDYCRICAKSDRKPLIPVLEDNPLHIDEKLKKLLQIKVLETSKLPKSICLDCLTKLNQFNDFFTSTQENQVILQIIFGEKSENVPTQCKFPQELTVQELTAKVQAVDDKNNFETFEHFIIEEITIDTALPEHDEELKRRDESCEEEDPVNELTSHLPVVSAKAPALKKTFKVPSRAPPHKNKFDRFDCHLCNEQSSRNSKFIEHFKTVHPKDELRYSCYICRLLLTKYRSYIRHVASHTEKRFACDSCGKSFAQKMTLVQHLNSHSTLKLFKCEECQLEFKQNSSLFKHRKTKHSNSGLICTECSKTFVNKETLKQHMRSKHNMKKDIVCHHCSKTFASRSAFAYHQSSKHPSVSSQTKAQVISYESICKVCDKSFKSQTLLIRHMKQSKSCIEMKNLNDQKSTIANLEQI